MDELGRIKSILEQVTTRSGDDNDRTEDGSITIEEESPFEMLLENIRILRQKPEKQLCLLNQEPKK